MMHSQTDWHLQAGLAVVFVELPEATRERLRPSLSWLELCPIFEEFGRDPVGRLAAVRPGSSSGSESRRNTLAIGVGVAVGLLILAVIAAFIWRRRQSDPKDPSSATTDLTGAAKAEANGAAHGGADEEAARRTDTAFPPRRRDQAATDEEVEEDHTPNLGLMYSPVSAQVTAPAAADFRAPPQMDARGLQQL